MISDIKLTVGPHDVLCGRNKVAFNNIGNRRFRIIVLLAVTSYVNVTITRKQKADIIYQIIASTHECGGRFLQEKNGVLQELAMKQAYDKVAHALRDMAQSKDIIDKSWYPEDPSSGSTKSINVEQLKMSSSQPPRLTLKGRSSKESSIIKRVSQNLAMNFVRRNPSVVESLTTTTTESDEEMDSNVRNMNEIPDYITVPGTLSTDDSLEPHDFSFTETTFDSWEFNSTMDEPSTDFHFDPSMFDNEIDILS